MTLEKSITEYGCVEIMSQKIKQSFQKKDSGNRREVMKSTSNIKKGIFHNSFIDDNGKVCEYSSLIIGSFVKNKNQKYSMELSS